MKAILYILVVTTLALSAANAQAKNCGETIRSAGSANVIPAIARHSALQAWRHEAAAVYGKRYASWDRALSRRLRRESAGDVTWRYVASARPCFSRH